MRKIEPEERQRMRQTYAKKIIKAVRTQGFQSLTIQDLADLMNMSRASLYNYFSSKEDIITEAAEVCMAYIREADQKISNEALPYPIRLQKVFEQAVFSAIYASDVFLHDLQTSCPLLFETKTASEKERLASLHSFYRGGMQKGIFHELNPSILIMQDEVVLRKMLSSSFLMEEGLSLKQALYDYYEAKKVQLVRPEHLPDQDHSSLHEGIERILRKLAET
ncbi:TetR/AcrR family transcriptional regulator [Paenibacillus sp. CC-CFT747]|nr:TetR/AcrR family transcriptional regulator [Paenibacillus sp. CC-CFT747]